MGKMNDLWLEENYGGGEDSVAGLVFELVQDTIES